MKNGENRSIRDGRTTNSEDDDSSSRKLYSSGSDSAHCSRNNKNNSVDNVRKSEVWLRRATPGAKLCVNNKMIGEKQIWTILASGDILTVGKEFTCILVDPSKKEDGLNLQGRISQAMKYARVLDRF